MKKTLLLLILLSTLIGCTKEPISLPEIENDGRRIVVSVADATTRMNYNHEGDAIKLTWEIDDRITIYNEDTSLRGEFKATSLLDNGKTAVFEIADQTVEPLVAGDKYFAAYPATIWKNYDGWLEYIEYTQEQSTNSLEHFSSYCKMTDDFIYDQEKIMFEHLLSTMLVKMRMPEGSQAPNSFEFTDGSEHQYTVNLSNLVSEQGVYTIALMIKSTTGLRDLYFKLTDGVNVNEIKIQTAVDYIPGMYYTADLSVNLDSHPLIIPNSSLKQALIDAGVDTNNDGNISRGEAAATRTLDLSSKNLFQRSGALTRNTQENSTSLDVLEHFPNLEELNLSDNGIESASELPMLDQLKTLDVSSNNLALVDATQYPNLQQDGLVCGSQTDENNNPKEVVVVLNDSQIGQIIDETNPSNMGLTELSKYVMVPFSSVEMGQYLIQMADMDFDGVITYEETSQIYELPLYEFGIVSLTETDLRFLPNLRSIDIFGLTGTVDIESLKKIERISIQSMDMSLITASKNTSLKEISLMECSNIDLTEFANSKGLKHLTISYIPTQQSGISPNLSAFINLTNLAIVGLPSSTMDLSKNTKLIDIKINNSEHLTSLTIDASLTDLKDLGIYDTNISSLSLGSKNLEYLGINNSKLTSFDVSSYPNLKTLDLSYNSELTLLTVNNNPLLDNISTSVCSSLTNLSLENIPNLLELSISKTNLSTIDITTFSKLKRLYCTNITDGIVITLTQTQNDNNIITGTSGNYQLIVK